ncbi:MAG: MlaD family protein, partial [Hyphococcus sp.]
TRAHYVLLGAFVMIAVALGFLFVLWKGTGRADYDEFDVIFTERVSGLLVGAQVRFNGIQKGTVDSLDLDPDNPGIVIARIHVDRDTPIKTDTRAELEPVGFTGVAIIQLVGGSADKPLLKESSDERVPRIVADTSGFGAFLQDTSDLVARAAQFMSDDNIDNVADIIENVEVITGAIADQDEEIAGIIQDAHAITADLAEATDALASLMENLDSFFAEDAPQTAQEAQVLLEESQALIAELRGVVEENRSSVRLFADQGLGQVAPALAEARRLMRTLDDMLREIDRDPQAYFLGENAPEYRTESE